MSCTSMPSPAMSGSISTTWTVFITNQPSITVLITALPAWPTYSVGTNTLARVFKYFMKYFTLILVFYSELKTWLFGKSFPP